ncbi:response regulator transcription factor [Anaerosporobacter sp.]|uniref:response regulator transcription factor n=1 Tax=Anaerosporobacter sp. TaxID=1872529 RepID=UPI00286EEB2C|nr:response regulator [Anaerosporobacter sp.]
MDIKLLVADDEDVIRNGISKYVKLHTDRFDKILLAENGQEAIEQILKYQPDIILLDVQMPLKTGLDVMKEIKLAGLSPIIIILSGYDEFKYAQQALRLGARDYLLKPVRSSDILNMLVEFADELEGPMDSKENNKETGVNPIVGQAKVYIEENYYLNLTLQQVADKVSISAGYLSTLFNQELGCGFVDYLNEVRVNHACTYLKQNYFKTYEIAYKIGFNDEKYFSKVFKKVKGMSPSEYKKGLYTD